MQHPPIVFGISVLQISSVFFKPIESCCVRGDDKYYCISFRSELSTTWHDQARQRYEIATEKRIDRVDLSATQCRQISVIIMLTSPLSSAVLRPSCYVYTHAHARIFINIYCTRIFYTTLAILIPGSFSRTSPESWVNQQERRGAERRWNIIYIRIYVYYLYTAGKEGRDWRIPTAR